MYDIKALVFTNAVLFLLHSTPVVLRKENRKKIENNLSIKTNVQNIKRFKKVGVHFSENVII